MEYRMTTVKRACGSTGSRFQKRKGRKVSIRRLRAKMAEIAEQQKRITKGHMEIRDWFEEINFECDQLKKETFLISKQAARNQRRLKLMFKIVKAREENNLSEVDKLTQSKKCRSVQSVYDNNIKIKVSNTMKHEINNRKRSGRGQTNIKRLRAEMAEIVEQQKRISEGQMEMRESVQEIECEYDQLRKERLLMSKQAARNQRSVNEMVKIVIGEV
ncbi:golgin subfamily member protein [Salix suchowensis]|nr:golgin subfamily member protein [Salix suchowensis]